MGFEPAGEADGVLSLVLPATKVVPRDGIITILDHVGPAD